MSIFRRAPDFVIGDPADPYLRRWWLIPRNSRFNVYLHEFRHSDDDRAMHDHPWWNISILLKGRYLERMPGRNLIRRRGSVIFRRAEQLHRIEIRPDETCWTLFITGPRVREWGFACPSGWRHWKEFTSPKNKGEVGRGCE
jgi:hypothetical protein